VSTALLSIFTGERHSIFNTVYIVSRCFFEGFSQVTTPLAAGIVFRFVFAVD